MFSFSQPDLISTVIASGIGTFAMLMLYVQFFKQKEDSMQFKVNMNYVIGLITGVVSIVTFLKILKEL
jgi:uncharacterized membrane-anchored protein